VGNTSCREGRETSQGHGKRGKKMRGLGFITLPLIWLLPPPSPGKYGGSCIWSLAPRDALYTYSAATRHATAPSLTPLRCQGKAEGDAQLREFIDATLRIAPLVASTGMFLAHKCFLSRSLPFAPPPPLPLFHLEDPSPTFFLVGVAAHSLAHTHRCRVHGCSCPEVRCLQRGQCKCCVCVCVCVRVLEKRTRTRHSESVGVCNCVCALCTYTHKHTVR
jgi:hypothetical protein